MKKRIFALTAVLAMTMLASCSNTQVAETEETTTSAAIEVVTEVATDEVSEVESAEEVADDTIETKVTNKTGSAMTDVKVIVDGEDVECGSLDAEADVLANLPKDAEELVLEFKIGEDTTRLPLEDGALGFNVVVSADNANGFLVDYIGIDE